MNPICSILADDFSSFGLGASSGGEYVADDRSETDSVVRWGQRLGWRSETSHCRVTEPGLPDRGAGAGRGGSGHAVRSRPARPQTLLLRRSTGRPTCPSVSNFKRSRPQLGRGISALPAPPGALAAELEHGSNFQNVVHQAAGMVAAQLEVSVAQALIRLRGHAFGLGQPLTDVAHGVVARRLRFDHFEQER